MSLLSNIVRLFLKLSEALGICKIFRRLIVFCPTLLPSQWNVYCMCSKSSSASVLSKRSRSTVLRRLVGRFMPLLLSVWPNGRQYWPVCPYLPAQNCLRCGTARVSAFLQYSSTGCCCSLSKSATASLGQPQEEAGNGSRQLYSQH